MAIQITSHPQQDLDSVRDSAMRWINFLVAAILICSISVKDVSAETEGNSQIRSSYEFSEDTAAGQVSNRTIVDIYPSEGTTWFVGPSVGQPPPFEGEYFLRAFKYPGDRTRFQLYVILKSRHHWLFLNRALDNNGNMFQVRHVNVDLDSGWKTEHLLIQLRGPYLSRLATKVGLSLKVSGKRGEIVLNVPDFYVKGFIRKVDFWTRAE